MNVLAAMDFSLISFFFCFDICRAIETNLRNNIGIDNLSEFRFGNAEFAIRYEKNGCRESNKKMFGT